jgi:hypothetical protein
MDIPASLVISIISLAVSAAALWNAYVARRHSGDSSLYELRRTTLSRARDLETEWQSILNDLYHCARNVEKDVEAQGRKDVILSWVAEIRPAFEASHKNVEGMRKALEEEFETISIDDARRYLREFEGNASSLRATRHELGRKLELLI